MSKVECQKGAASRARDQLQVAEARKNCVAAIQPSASVARLSQELVAMLPELDEEGLSFLVEQARLRRKALAEARALYLSSLEIAREAETELKIGRCDDGSTYYIVSGPTWKLFSADEIAALVRIARNEEETAAARSVFLWLLEERRDVLGDLHIQDEASERLPELIELLRTNFPVRSPRRP